MSELHGNPISWPQYKLELVVHDPELREGLAQLEVPTTEEPNLGREFAVRSIRTMAIDPSNKYAVDEFKIYRQGIQGLANADGSSAFALTDFVELRQSSNRADPISMVKFMLSLDDLQMREMILRRPMFGPGQSDPPHIRASALHLLNEYRATQELPVVLKLERPVDDVEERIAAIHELLSRTVDVENPITGRDEPKPIRTLSRLSLVKLPHNPSTPTLAPVTPIRPDVTPMRNAS